MENKKISVYKDETYNDMVEVDLLTGSEAYEYSIQNGDCVVELHTPHYFKPSKELFEQEKGNMFFINPTNPKEIVLYME